MEDIYLPMDIFETGDEGSGNSNDIDDNMNPFLDENDDENNDNNTVDGEENQENVDSEDVNEGDDENDNGDSSSNLYTSLASVIHEQGLLPSVDITKEKIESVDDLTRILQIEQEAQAQRKLDEYIANLDVNKLSKPIAEVRNLESIDSEYLKDNIETAKDLIRKDYIAQGLDETKVNRIVNRLVDLGDEDLIDEALKAKENIVESNRLEIENEKLRYAKLKEEEAVNSAKMQENIKKAVFESELIPGFKANNAFRDKVYKNITTVVGEGPNGELENAFMRARREDVLGFETRMYAFYELTNGFTDFGKLSAPAKSSAVKELEKAARGYAIKDNGTPTYVQDTDSYYGSSDFSLNF